MELHLTTTGGACAVGKRKRELLEIGEQNQKSVETAKMSLFASAVGGIFLSSSIPFVAIPIAVICGASYAVALIEEMKHTGGGLRPLPVSRADFFGFIEGNTSGQVDDEDDDDEPQPHFDGIDPRASYLARAELSEFLLLDLFGHEIGEYLDTIDPELWGNQYTKILRVFDKSVWLDIAKKDPALAIDKVDEFMAIATKKAVKPALKPASPRALPEPADDGPVIQPRTPIGENTRLRAFTIPARPVAPTMPDVQTRINFGEEDVEDDRTEDFWRDEEEEVEDLVPPVAPDIVDKIIVQGNSLVFMGGQGVGKSRLMAIASQQGLKSGKYHHVTVCSGLAKPGEDPIYWQHCKQKLFFDLAPMSYVDRVVHLQKQLQAIQIWKKQANSERPGLLILDEIAYLASIVAGAKEESVEGQLAHEICDILRVVCSGGDKRGWYVWFGSPKGAISALGQIGTEMKGLKLVFCGIAPNSSVRSRGSMTSWDDGLFASAKLNWKDLRYPSAHLSDRIVYFDSQWYQQTSYELMEYTPEALPQNAMPQTKIIPPSNPRSATPSPQNDNKEALVEGLLEMIDFGCDEYQALSATNLQKAIKKKYQRDMEVEKVGGLMVRIVQGYPKKYELVSGASEVTIKKLSTSPAMAPALTGMRDTLMTGLR